MRYRVRGADRDSGAAVERVIDAPDEAAARVQAGAAGLMVETLTALTGGAVPGYAVRVLAASVPHGQDGAEAIRATLEKLLNAMAAQGWEFVSVQTVPTLILARQGHTGRVSGADVPANVSLAVFRSRV